MSNDLRQTAKFARYMEAINWQTYQAGQTRFYLKKIPLLGNFIKIPRPSIPPKALTLKALAKKYRAFAVRVDYSPSKTLQVDLTRPLEEIVSRFNKQTRYELRLAEKNQLQVENSADIEAFIKMWHQNAFQKGFWIPFGREIRRLYQSFQDNRWLLLTKDETGYLAGALILLTDQTAAYFSAASTSRGRQLAAPTLIILKAMQMAKARGCRVFDFEGLKDDRDPNTKSWSGFTHFKKGFGGKEVEYPLAKTKFFFLNFFRLLILVIPSLELFNFPR